MFETVLPETVFGPFPNFNRTDSHAAPDQQLRFGFFREGVFQKMPALEGQFLKEIAVRFAGENHLRTQKNWAPQAPEARGDEILRFQSQEP